MEFEKCLRLQQRVSGRLVLFDVSTTGVGNLIEHRSGDLTNGLEYRRWQLLNLQDAVIDLEGLSSGVSIASLTLTDFRFDLADYDKCAGDTLDGMALGAYGVAVPADAEGPPGVISSLRAEDEVAGRLLEAGFSLPPNYLVHVSEDGSVLLRFTQAMRILDRLKRLCLGDLPDSLACSRFDKASRHGNDMRTMQRLLASAVASIVGRGEKRAAASLFSPSGTHAMAGYFTGIEDFKVVAFLVVLAEEAT